MLSCAGICRLSLAPLVELLWRSGPFDQSNVPSCAPQPHHARPYMYFTPAIFAASVRALRTRKSISPPIECLACEPIYLLPLHLGSDATRDSLFPLRILRMTSCNFESIFGLLVLRGSNRLIFIFLVSCVTCPQTSKYIC